MSSTGSERLNVIALVSGGKDSFFSALHCQANEHRIIALANLHPALPGADDDERDLNSFMYQTVGHQVIPLYAEVAGVPLYRGAITGRATQHGKEYSHRGPVGAPQGAEDSEGSDETESMVPLLQAIKNAHPEANAVCAGAILSTYQRTRVESVAIRLGLVPLAFLWKFPVLPTPTPPDPAAAGSDAQLLDDMAAAGLEARIIKVASGGLDDSFLWTDAASPAGKAKLARAMRRFGAAETGAVIGEGGEFETLVLDGPPTLFRKRIVVAEEDRRVIREGGGSAWLSLRNARLEEKGIELGEERKRNSVRIPDLLDPRFVRVLDTLSSPGGDTLGPDVPSGPDEESFHSLQLGFTQASTKKLQQWRFVGGKSTSIEAETRIIVEQIRQRLQQHSLPPSAILNATVVLSHMADFPAVNSVYGTLFDAPNPPSRVTISCGDALSATADADIAVYLTVHMALQPGQRQGLHVQSRSYWAPANIGPYSQAISVPVASLGPPEHWDPSSSSSGPKLVSIAGQIPLIPASMTLPAGGGEEGLQLQVVLSLQHLWRVGVEMGVQWWSSAVAYVAKGGPHHSARKVELVTTAWKAANAPGSGSPAGDDEEQDEEGEETGPDLWDRRFDSRYLTFAGGQEKEKKAAQALPDRGILSRDSAPSSPTVAAPVPPVFVAEVDELPRGAAVEWHAHVGIAHAGEGSVVLREVCLTSRGGEGGRDVVVSQVIMESGGGGKGVRYVQFVVAEPFAGGGQKGLCGKAAKAALAQLGREDVSPDELAVMARYVDAEIWKEGGNGGDPVVPCRSLWDDKGARLAAVTVYQSVFE